MYNKIDLREVPAERLKEISLDLVDIDAQAPEFEPNRQFYFMAKARDYVKRKSAELGRPITFFTQTFGCGIATLALQNYSSIIWIKTKTILSMILTIISVVIFIASLEPYVAFFTFVLLIIKGALLLKRP